MEIEFRYDVGQEVDAIDKKGTFRGVVTTIQISQTGILYYVSTQDENHDGAWFKQDYLSEIKPDIIMYARVHTVGSSAHTASHVTNATLSRGRMDNVKITYDGSGIFKAIEKI